MWTLSLTVTEVCQSLCHVNIDYKPWSPCFAWVVPPFLFTSNLLSQAFIQPCCPSCGTFVQVRHSFFAFSMVEEFTLFTFHFSHPVQEQYLHDLTQAIKIAFHQSFELSTSDYIASLNIAFGAFLSEDQSASLKLLPFVRWYFLTFFVSSRSSFLSVFSSFPAPPVIPSSLLALCEKQTIFQPFECPQSCLKR